MKKKCAIFFLFYPPPHSLLFSFKIAAIKIVSIFFTFSFSSFYHHHQPSTNPTKTMAEAIRPTTSYYQSICGTECKSNKQQFHGYNDRYI
jgi:hypothetical protein